MLNLSRKLVWNLMEEDHGYVIVILNISKVELEKFTRVHHLRG